MKILVTGATGNIGRRLVDQLVARGATDVRALTNNPGKADLPSTVEVVEGYLGHVDTVPAALDGVEAMYLAPVPETVRQVAAHIEQSGVCHVVDLSGEPDSWWYEVVDAVEKMDVGWTHLWPGEFMENSTIWVDQIRTTGTVREPYPASANAPIAMDDIVSVAATVLLEGADANHLGRAYSLTGPETLTRKDMVEHIGAALGRRLRFEEVSHEQAVTVLAPIMGEYAQWYVDGIGELVAEPQPATPTVAEITGRSATTFAEWAIQNVDLFQPEHTSPGH